MKAIYKVQIWLQASKDGEPFEGIFRDCYFDLDKVTAWYIPLK